MNSSDPPARRVVKILWGDAFIDPGSFTEEEAQATVPVWTVTAGFLIAKNSHGYVLSTDVYIDNPDCGACMFIPHGMVKDVKYLD